MTTVSSSSSAWNKGQWQGEESTNAILKRDTGIDVHGSDKTWRETKTEQQTHVGESGAAKVGVTAFEAAEIAGAVHAGVVGAIAAPIAGFGLGWYGLVHAHKDADGQNAAAMKDQAHVALVGALELPENCKIQAYAQRAGTPKDFQSKVDAMTNSITSDTAGLAVLQAHCDRGVMSAYASIPMPMPNGMTLDKFLESRPQLKQICDEDAAFKVGFESFWNAGPADRKTLLDNVNKHDVRSGNGVHIGG